MAKLPKSFKREKYGKMKDFSSIPNGDYIGKIVKSEYKPNKKNDGHYISLTVEIANGEHKGHKVFPLLNVDNPSEKAMEIANEELATICDAVGKTDVKDTDELHGILMAVKLTTKDGKNEVAMYAPIEDSGIELDDEDEDDKPKKKKGKKGKKDKKGKKGKKGKSKGEDKEELIESVKELARELKGEVSAKKFGKVLDQYDISKVSGIDDLSEDDLTALKEDLEDEIEDL